MQDPNKALAAQVGALGGLSPAQYRELVKACPPPTATVDTTPTQAAWLLGVQFVLTKIQEDVR